MAHVIGGDDVVAVLPFASAPVALVLTRGFEHLLGIPPSKCPTREQQQ